MSFTTRALIILTSLNLLDYLDRYLIASLGSLVKGEMGLSDRAFGFLGTAFFLVYLCASPIFGYLGDRWGRLRLMAGGAVLWSLATSLTFWVGSYPGPAAGPGGGGGGRGLLRHPGAGLPGGYPPPGAPGPGSGIVLPGHSGGLGPGLPGGRPDGQPLGLAPGLSRWPACRAWSMAALVYRLPVEVRPPAAALPRPASSPLLGDSWGLLNIPTLRWVTLGYGMVTFALGGLAFWMPRYLEVSKGLSLAQANLLLFGSVAVAGGSGHPDRGLFGGSSSAPNPAGPPLGQRPGHYAWPCPWRPWSSLSPSPGLYVPALAGWRFFCCF